MKHGSGEGYASRQAHSLRDGIVSLEITSRQAGRVHVLHVAGRFTLADGGTRLRDAIHVLTRGGHKGFLLNLAGVEFIDSYGIGELVRCYAAVKQLGGELRLVSVSKNVLDLLHISKVHSIFAIHAEEAQALHELESRK